MKIKYLIIPALLTGCALTAEAAKVKVIMNSISTTMTMKAKGSDTPVETGTPDNKYTYTFEAPAGDYVITGIAKNGTTVNGSIAVTVADSDAEQELKVLTVTAYVNNKHADKSSWTLDGGDYTIDLKVNSREGETVETTLGNHTTVGRNTFLALNGNSYYIEFIPSAEHQAEGYLSLFKSATLTFNATASGEIPMSALFPVTVPAEAKLQIGRKGAHFVDFTVEQPVSVETEGSNTVYTYKLAQGQVYNYRTWMDGALTQGGYFTVVKDETKRPVISFTDADYKGFDPQTINHDVQSNKGYETGDIFVNINPQGHLALRTGETFAAHAMRTWELTDNQTNNYFIEPDFHYTVIGLDGKPSADIIDITSTPGSAWAQIKAIGAGTAIVLVTYDAIKVNYFSNATEKEYLGGQYWGAIWPENTAAYIVTVDQKESAAVANMTINEQYNQDAKKLAGKYVDAEHDVFYYLDTEEGHHYTFTPESVAEVTIAYPTIGERMASYSGFSTDGVTRNADGSYTLLLKEGRQIVKLTDAGGNATYQVLTAKKCHREIANLTSGDNTSFRPGDEIGIQYSGLRHPANKLAGIYNMSAYVTYNGTPNGTSLILGSGQYTFGSAAGAQLVKTTIPADFDTSTASEFVLDEGVIQVNGYGDPIGSHRNINPTAGRSPNFTAIAHKTYFGYVPEVRIPVSGTSGITDIIRDEPAGAPVYYNLQGIASDRPYSGLNIVRDPDGTTRKIYLR